MLLRSSRCHSRPSKRLSTGPRQYSWALGGGVPSKRTRKATLSSLATSATPPSVSVPDRPVRAPASCGSAHKGPTRGNSRNSATITGMPNSVARAARPPASRSAGRPTGMCASTSAVSRPQTAMIMAAATGSVCEYRKLVSTRKKPRKNTTSASRRARSSRVLSTISITSRVTPASLPSSVR